MVRRCLIVHTTRANNCSSECSRSSEKVGTESVTICRLALHNTSFNVPFYPHYLDYCKTLIFRRILISQFHYVENSLHFNFVDFTLQAYHITEELIFYADKIMVMGNLQNLCVFNFTILLKLQNPREIYRFYSNVTTPGRRLHKK